MHNWRPSATPDTLIRRAAHMAEVRHFFKKRGVLEVDTPLLMPGTGTDVQLSPLSVKTHKGESLFLQTSPEFAMKRLLAAGLGAIYQITKAFRDEEKGRYHNLEFSMLEWYRPTYSLEQLIAEVFELFAEVSAWPMGEIKTYQAIFQEYLGFCPHQITEAELHQRLLQTEMVSKASVLTWSKDDCLDCLLSHSIQPNLGRERPIAITEYPASQAALAVIENKPEGYAVGRRFEVYYQGIELANGYDELTDANEQQKRFIIDNQEREKRGLPILPVDQNFLQALESGIPSGSGVALGLDRWIMLALGFNHLKDIQSFY